MRLHKCGIVEFFEKTKDKPVVCFGASPLISDMCTFYYQHKPWRNIAAIADNNKQKHGAKVCIMWDLINVISVDELIDMYIKDKSTVLLITVNLGACSDVFKQLNDIPALNDMECYIYMMFPFCDAFDQIPEEILRAKSSDIQIPKIIHYVWVGGGAIPEANLKWMESWKKHCPDYEIKLWNESNYDIEKNQYMYGAYKAGKYGFVPDYMRLDIIYQHGGIYLDTDVEVLRPFDDLLYHEAFWGMITHALAGTGSGFGAAKGNELVKEMRDIYDDVNFVRRDGRLNVVPCDFYQTEVLKRHGFFGGNKFHVVNGLAIYPACYFSPLSSSFGMPCLREYCYSIHHFDNSWFDAQRLESKTQRQKVFLDAYREGETS